MSRFFKTSEVNPNNSFLYKAPHEIMMKALEVQQQGYNDTLAKAELFDTLDIKYINNPTVQDRVQKIKADYEGKANEITEAISADPTKWNKMSPKLRQLSARLKEDMTSGAIANIQGTYANYQNFLENNKDKDARVMQMANNYYMNDYNNRVQSNPDVFMNFDDVVNPVDLMSDKYQKILKEVKANKSMTTDGRYVYKNEEITPERAEQIAYGLLMSDPEYKTYSNQQMKFGDTGFIDINEDGSVSPKNVYEIYDTDGNVLTRERAEELHNEWSALDVEQKKITPYPFKTGLNMSHSMAGGLKALGSAYSFFDKSFDADKYGLQNNQGQINSRLAAQKYGYDVNLENIKQANRETLADKNNAVKLQIAEMRQKGSSKDINTLLQLELAKETPGSQKYKNLESAIAQNNVDSALGHIYGRNLDLSTVINDANSGDSESSAYIGNARDSGRKAMGYKSGSDEHNLMMTFDYYMKKGQSKEQAIKSAVSDLRGIYAKKNNYNGTQQGALAASTVFDNNLSQRYSGLLNKYFNKQNDYLGSLSSVNSNLRFEPTSSYADTNLTKLIKDNPGTFTITDKNGNLLTSKELNKLGDDIKVTHLFGSNPYGNVGIRANVGGKDILYVPSKKGSSVNRMVTNIALNNGLKDPKNSTMLKTISNQENSDIETIMFNTKPVNGAKRFVYTSKLGGSPTDIYFHSDGSGIKFSTDPNVNWNNPDPVKGKYATAESIQQIFDNIADMD